VRVRARHYYGNGRGRSSFCSNLIPRTDPVQAGLVVSWFVVSLGAIIVNKELLSGDPERLWHLVTLRRHDEFDIREPIVVTPLLISLVQCATTCVLGACKVLGLPFLAYLGHADHAHLVELKNMLVARSGVANLALDMCMVGFLRAGSMITCMFALRTVAASFTQCVKSSQPLFTVLLTYMMLGKTTKWYIVVTLLPVVIGLGVASLTEASCTTFGLAAAMASNILDVVQNVYSKKLTNAGYSANQLQFLTSISATLIQLPFMMLKKDLKLFFDYLCKIL
jgi:drug/metabolite transporter (DMT)-like permease